MAGEESKSYPQRTSTRFQDSADNVDITVWDAFAPFIREGDIVVNTVAKSGTTWMMQLILQTINNGEETLSLPDNTINNSVPWIEDKLTFPDVVEKLKATPPHHRRVIKSHLPLDALLFSPKIRYVCVFRDGRDIVMSLYNHLISQTEDFRQATHQPGAKWEDFDILYENWLHHGMDRLFLDYFHHVWTWWKHASDSRDNILLVNYNDMQSNLADVVLRLAKFLDIPVDDETSASFQNILRHSSFQYMKQHEELFELPPNTMKPGNFIHKGVSGRWRDVLSESQHQMYWDKVTQCWPPELIEFVHKDSG